MQNDIFTLVFSSSLRKKTVVEKEFAVFKGEMVASKMTAMALILIPMTMVVSRKRSSKVD